MPPAQRLALALACAACASQRAPAYFPADIPAGGRDIVLEKTAPGTPRTSVVITIRERPRRRTHGELQLQHWHRPGRAVAQAQEPIRPEYDVLDSVEQAERRALDGSFGCREWRPLVEYHGNWGWSCLAPLVAGQPDWARLARRVDDFRARRAEKRAIRPPGIALDTLNPATWWVTVWTGAGSDGQFALPMRPSGAAP
jgi:hypothetical protein